MRSEHVSCAAQKHTKPELVACDLLNVVLALTSLFLTSSFKPFILPTTMALDTRWRWLRCCQCVCRSVFLIHSFLNWNVLRPWISAK